MTRTQIARFSLWLGLASFLLGGSAMCPCPELFIVSAVFAILGLLLGSRDLRVWSLALLFVSVVVAITELGRDREYQERMRKSNETYQMIGSNIKVT